jgi:hypothetical protein
VHWFEFLKFELLIIEFEELVGCDFIFLVFSTKQVDIAVWSYDGSMMVRNNDVRFQLNFLEPSLDELQLCFKCTFCTLFKVPDCSIAIFEVI